MLLTTVCRQSCGNCLATSSHNHITNLSGDFNARWQPNAKVLSYCAALDQVFLHNFIQAEVMADAHSGAIKAPGFRDTFDMKVPFKELVGNIDPAFSGALFPGAELDKPDVSSYLEDPRVPQEVRDRVILAVEEAPRSQLRESKGTGRRNPCPALFLH